MEIEEGNEHMREVKAIKINLNVRYHLKSLDIVFNFVLLSQTCPLVTYLAVLKLALSLTVYRNIFHFCSCGTFVFGH